MVKINKMSEVYLVAGTEKDKVTAKVEDNTLRIYMGELLHLSVFMGDLFAVQAWIETDSDFRIEYHLRSLRRPVVSIYTSQETWKEVIKAIAPFV